MNGIYIHYGYICNRNIEECLPCAGLWLLALRIQPILRTKSGNFSGQGVEPVQELGMALVMDRWFEGLYVERPVGLNFTFANLVESLEPLAVDDGEQLLARGTRDSVL